MSDVAKIKLVVIWEEEVRELAKAVHRFHKHQSGDNAEVMALAALNLVNNKELLDPKNPICMARKSDIRIEPKKSRVRVVRRVKP